MFDHAAAVERDLGAVAGVEGVTTRFTEPGPRELRFVATVRVGPRDWLPDLNAILTPYPYGGRRAHPLASVR